MLRHRLIAGTILAVVIIGIMLGDAHFAPYSPLLLLFIIVTGSFASWELLQLIPQEKRPPTVPTILFTVLVLASNWANPILGANLAWLAIVTALILGILASFLLEVVRYNGESGAIARIQSVMLSLFYLGLLPSFLLQMRWFPSDIALTALLLTIFVPKVGDIGAYFSGRFLGKHRFAPRLSPKKTWEGFVGGIIAAMATAIAVEVIRPIFPIGLLEAATFGLVIGLMGVLGDLAESLLKRDAGVKDAAKVIPGFGGVLDVIDAILFAGPIAYLWFVGRAICPT